MIIQVYLKTLGHWTIITNTTAYGYILEQFTPVIRIIISSCQSLHKVRIVCTVYLCHAVIRLLIGSRTSCHCQAVEVSKQCLNLCLIDLCLFLR